MAISLTGNEITPEVIEEANKAADEALRGLWEIFSKPSPTPVQSFTRYDLAIENGEVRWVPSETDLLIERLIEEMFEGG